MTITLNVKQQEELIEICISWHKLTLNYIILNIWKDSSDVVCSLQSE